MNPRLLAPWLKLSWTEKIGLKKKICIHLFVCFYNSGWWCGECSLHPRETPQILSRGHQYQHSMTSPHRENKVLYLGVRKSTKEWSKCQVCLDFLSLFFCIWQQIRISLTSLNFHHLCEFVSPLIHSASPASSVSWISVPETKINLKYVC